LSPYHFSRAFKKTLGMPPRRYPCAVGSAGQRCYWSSRAYRSKSPSGGFRRYELVFDCFPLPVGHAPRAYRCQSWVSASQIPALAGRPLYNVARQAVTSLICSGVRFIETVCIATFCRVHSCSPAPSARDRSCRWAHPDLAGETGVVFSGPSYSIVQLVSRSEFIIIHQQGRAANIGARSEGG
jgi:hypothetical protein